MINDYNISKVVKIALMAKKIHIYILCTYIHRLAPPPVVNVAEGRVLCCPGGLCRGAALAYGRCINSFLP